jgi:3'-phosphoadenosine 5'-phosphosulfate sulfotransferase (PAPS reductase)/FAD synthetase
MSEYQGNPELVALTRALPRPEPFPALPANFDPQSKVARVVGFSGGADSQACALWVRQRCPASEIILLNSDPGGNEAEETHAFIRWYSENVFPVVTIHPLVLDLGNRGTMPGGTRDRRREFEDLDPMTFPVLAYIKGRWPSRKAQFCTEHLKLEPQRRWCRALLTDQGIDVIRYAGVRRDESNARRGREEKEWDSFFDCELELPLAHWTKKQVFDSLIDAGEPFNPLYLQGFGRVGCAPCINSGKADVREWAARQPAIIDKIREWERLTGRTYFPPCVPGKEINWIEEVVAWSRTARGGNQILLPMLENDIPVCSSRYGLCE